MPTQSVARIVAIPETTPNRRRALKTIDDSSTQKGSLAAPLMCHACFLRLGTEKLSRAARTAAAVLFELQFTLSQVESFLLQ